MLSLLKIRVGWMVAMVMSLFPLAAQSAPTNSSSSSEYGTCAIALATKDNVALIVDSRLTLIGADQSCSESYPTGCKAVLVRPDILLAVTGIFNDPVNGVPWKVGDETRRLLLELPPTLETKDLDAFARSWFNVLVKHYRRKAKLELDPEREVSTLLIATRVHGIPYVYKDSIFLDKQGLFESNGGFLYVSDYPQLFYAGSCHDNIDSHPEGRFAPAPDPPNALYRWELNELGERKLSARSIQQFVPILIDYEKLFAKIGESKDKCWIGPPYDIATWAKGKEGWSTNFKVKCRPLKQKTRTH